MNEVLIEYLTSFLDELKNDKISKEESFNFVVKLFLYFYSNELIDFIQEEINNNKIIKIENLKVHPGVFVIKDNLDNFRNLLSEILGINIFKDKIILDIVNSKLEEANIKFNKEDEWEEIIT